ncbi:MAG TPA: hypothetical protein VMV56_00300 [Williamwhitmania sp.]|nr:hypothetical protein [Williamwhitmania sp.]
MNTEEKVVSTLKNEGKPLKAGEIAELSGIEKKEVEKSIKKLVANNIVESPKRCFYSLKSK